MSDDTLGSDGPGPAQSVNIASSPVLVKGNFQILPMRGPETVGEMPAYSVLTLAGQPVRQELSLDEAKVWLDRLASESPSQPQQSAPVRTRLRR